jgi:hypothetical protein
VLDTITSKTKVGQGKTFKDSDDEEVRSEMLSTEDGEADDFYRRTRYSSHSPHKQTKKTFFDSHEADQRATVNGITGPIKLS